MTGTPTTKFDGIVSVVGGVNAGTMYPSFRNNATTRLAVDSPLEITLECAYDTTTNQGTVQAVVDNTTATAVSGNLHFVVVEDDIPYVWGGGQMSELDQVMRDMLPDAAGEAVTVPASDTIMRARAFTIGAAWNEMKCKIIVFLQGTSREIYQGAELRITPVPAMVYFGLTLSEIAGNGNGYAEPGETIEVSAVAKNMGGGYYSNPVTVACADPYVSNLSSAAHTFSIGPGDVDTVAGWSFEIAAGCPDPHLAEFSLIFGNADTSAVPLLVATRSGISDDMESGQGGWTHWGTYDNWHLTEHKSNSPTHSWYCGIANVWHYNNQNDISLVSPYFIVSPDSAFSFYHQYALELNWDYTYVEVENGSGWWQTLDQYTGTQATWTQASFPLAGYDGQTVRVRFRLVSDASVYAEGWYVDDVLVPMLGAEELNAPQDLKTIALSVAPNPFTMLTNISFGIEQSAERIELGIYDATGRLVRDLSYAMPHAPCAMQVAWDGKDDIGRRVGSGVYFVTLENAGQKLVEKVVLLK